MLNSKRIAAAAGVLCGLALLGTGQAFAHDSATACAENGKGNGRCVQEAEYHFTTDEHGNVHLVNKQSQECSSGECVSVVTVGGETVDDEQES